MKKLTYALVFMALAMLSARSTRSQTLPNDPRIGGGGTGSCMTIQQNSSSLDVTVPTGCVVDFVNDLGTTLTFVTVTLDPTEFTGSLSCIIDFSRDDGFSPFSTATLSSPNSCTFSGGATEDAVPPHGGLGVQFGYPDAPFSSSTLDVKVSTVPEPGSLALIGTGLAAFVARRRKLGSKPQAA